jgi:glycolate oxidase
MLDALTTALPDGAVLTDPDVMAAYRQDWARDPNAGHPIAVVRATATADVVATLRWATEHGVPVVPRGAGSGLSGGATAVDGGIVLSLERMRDIDVDPAMRVAIAQPGALNVEVKQAAA